jgi:hypothetical protein
LSFVLNYRDLITPSHHSLYGSLRRFNFLSLQQNITEYIHQSTNVLTSISPFHRLHKFHPVHVSIFPTLHPISLFPITNNISIPLHRSLDQKAQSLGKPDNSTPSPPENKQHKHVHFSPSIPFSTKGGSKGEFSGCVNLPNALFPSRKVRGETVHRTSEIRPRDWYNEASEIDAKRRVSNARASQF